ncbi:MAG: MBL fold metallo-hydrolase [Bryobacteraceae bacterium]|nr:MBL fold metallo-hydrolase [Bryobacteraceae bacterium]MDW8377112.1 MBL fold metallo-hydrolase [Bryobacterales bacterium]
MKPHKITLYVYNVGFGDCFLLCFHYQRGGDRYVLIDFGTTAAPKGFSKERGSRLLADIAEDIRIRCGKAGLTAVVATHRHRDHISGFATSKDGKGPGDIIRNLKPKVVIQPWTEDPKAPVDALSPVQDPGRAQAFLQSLQDMQRVAEAIVQAAAPSNRSWLGKELRSRLAFLGEDNLANESAVKNLMTMGLKQYYVYFQSRSGLERLLPGVKVHVLGPPTLRQSDAIRSQRSRDPDEFWHFHRYWGFQARAAEHEMRAVKLFQAETLSVENAPVEMRWFCHRVRAIRGEQLLNIVRELDRQLNNTSLILLFETGGKRLLFPGDAQIENWSYALEKLHEEGKLDLLAGVDLYKVGHHGSLNATPKSLWSLFEKRGGEDKPERLKTVLSTLPGKHGSERTGTEVPRKKLVEALRQESELFSTNAMKVRDGLCKVIEIPL